MLRMQIAAQPLCVRDEQWWRNPHYRQWARANQNGFLSILEPDFSEDYSSAFELFSCPKGVYQERLPLAGESGNDRQKRSRQIRWDAWWCFAPCGALKSLAERSWPLLQTEKRFWHESVIAAYGTHWKLDSNILFYIYRWTTFLSFHVHILTYPKASKIAAASLLFEQYLVSFQSFSFTGFKNILFVCLKLQWGYSIISAEQTRNGSPACAKCFRKTLESKRALYR